MDNLRIRKYMDQLFENGPINRRTLELKEELIANALEKYNDLTLQSTLRLIICNGHGRPRKRKRR